MKPLRTELRFFEAIKGMGLEGIMAKKKRSTYSPGKRSNEWLKIKVRTLIDVRIIGYTKGNGDRSALFGALHIGSFHNEKLSYLGKVGSGFDETALQSIYEILKTKPVIPKPIKEAVEEEYNTIWITDGPECEVQYASMTPNGTLREPVFYRLKEVEE